MQRRKDIYGSTADDFDPSRMTTPPAPWTYLPFGGGPRTCLGRNFALTEMAYVVARMCQTFMAIEERSGEERGTQGFRTDIVLIPLKGVKVGLIPVETLI